MVKKSDSSDTKKSSVLKTPGFWRQLKIYLEEIEIPALIILGLGSVILGTLGFQKYYESTHITSNFGTYLYSSVGLLQLKNGNINALTLPIELEIARWLAPAVTMYTVLRGLWFLFKKQLEVLYLSMFIQKHVVICGLGQIGLLLAKNLRNQGQSVVVVEKSGSNPNIPACKETGALVLIGDAEDISILHKAGVKRAHHVVAISGKDSTNAKIATHVRSLVRKQNNPKNSEPLRCTIHIEDQRLWNVLRKQEFSVEKTPGFHLEIFNLYDEAVFQLLTAYPLPKHENNDRPKPPPHVLIIGLGDMGERLSLHLSREWSDTYRQTQQKLRLSVIDPDAKHKVETLCRQFSLLDEVCDWDPYLIDTHLPNYYPEGLTHADLSLVFICIGDEGAGTSAALSLLEQPFNPEKQIIVRVNEDNGLEMMLNEISQAGKLPGNLHFFNVFESTCRPELLYNRLQEMIAQSIHQDYIHNQKKKGKSIETNSNMNSWEKLEEEIKQTNRDQADNILCKLHTVNCDIAPWTRYGADQFTFEENEVLLLAKMEHERWCQQKKAQGWRYNKERNDLKKKHNNLLKWDDLAQDVKDKDMEAVRNIPHLLAQVGFQIYRLSDSKS